MVSMHYPIRGFFYLLSSPTMWGTVICVVLLGVTICLSTTLVLFLFTLKPQAEAFGGGEWWSWVLAVLAVLAESLLVSVLVLKVTQSKAQKKIFVETMRLEGMWKPGMIEPSLAKDINCCRFGFLIRIVTFPLNLIPVVGTIAFAFINAPFEAWDLMDMYFDAIGMDYNDQLVEVSGHNTKSVSTCCSMYTFSAYVRFGFVAVLLETIPIAGPAIFSISNVCGGALWACDMEANGGPYRRPSPPPLTDK